MELAHPTSVIDVGCGTGAWLAEFQAQGVTDFLGIDGEYVDRRMLKVRSDRFTGMDLTKRFQLDRQFDLAISLEVAEHLPSTSAAGFVESLVRLAPIVVFSAAVRGQGGVAHINEQWPEYWKDHFARHDYILVDCLRSRLWLDEEILWHYRQNILVFVRSNAIAAYPMIHFHMSSSDQSPLSIVHPGMYAGLHYTTDPQNMSLEQSWRNFQTSLLRSIKRLLPRRSVR